MLIGPDAPLDVLPSTDLIGSRTRHRAGGRCPCRPTRSVCKLGPGAEGIVWLHHAAASSRPGGAR